MRMTFLFLVSVYVLLAGIVSADLFGTGDNQFEIEFVTISGDTNPISGFGIVNNDYRIGKYEITNDQFAKFADNNSGHKGTNIPANNVNWYEAAQFINYLNTSMGHQVAYKFTGGTFSPWAPSDTGYDASNPFRNSNAHYFLPTEDEWVKAAYWNGTNLQTYASVGDIAPTHNGWNFSSFEHTSFEPWDVGGGSEELNGTFDMMGNIWEWMENPYDSGNYISGSTRGIRGGSYNDWFNVLMSSYRDSLHSSPPSGEYYSVGFRVASIPEPATLALLALGSLAMLRRRK